MKTPGQNLRLLPADRLIRTSPIDHADWNFKPLLGWIQRLRFKLILSLLPSGKIPRLLEVGYGSGLFMPALACRCDELYGIDIHEKNREVTDCLAAFGVNANLTSASAEEMPYPDNFFDCAVAVSSLEFIPRIEAAVEELKRIIKPGGALVLVTPGQSVITDIGLRILTGESAKRDFSDRREGVVPSLLRQFSVRAKRDFPTPGGRIFRLYSAYDLRPNEPVACSTESKSG